MASTYITKTPSSTTNQKTWTVSCWVKRAKLGSRQMIWGVNGDTSGNYFTQLEFNASDSLEFTQGGTVGDPFQTQMITNRKFRDTNAWYHIVVAPDTTQGTESNRLKIYVNGEQMTSFSTANYPSQDEQFRWHYTGYAHSIGRSGSDSARYFDGCISHFHNIDGTQYAASDFGETDATTGEWKIKTSPSVTYGSFGTFILKDGNSVTDQSGRGNNWTVGGGTLTKTEDSPSNNFCTLNSLDMVYGNSSLSQGNNTQNQTAASNHYAFVNGTLGFNSGKWYWEMKCVSGHSDNWYGVGITSTQCTANNNWLGQNADSYAIYGYSYGGGLASTYTGGTRTNQGTTFTAGDIIGVAVDCDNMAIYFSKNGTWMSNASSVQGVPTSGSSKTGSFYTISDPATRKYNAYGGFYLPSVCYYDARTAVQSVNFGNGYFGTTAVSSAGTNASGNGIFEYDVPTGYTALSTKGLNL